MKTRFSEIPGWLVVMACAGVSLPGAASGQVQNMFVSSDTGNKIYEVTPGGTVSTFATVPYDIGQMAFNSSGDLFGGVNSVIYEITPGGSESPFAAQLSDIGGLAFNSAGDLFVSEFNVNGSIIEITPSGVESTFATGLNEPRGLAFNSAGDLFVGTATNITEITPGDVKSVFVPGLSGGVNSLAFNDAGNLFAVFDSREILEITPNGTQSTFATPPSDPEQMAFNGQGILFLASESGDVVEYNSSGTQSTFVPGLGEAIGVAFQPVPEPSALGLLGMGAVAYFIWRRTGAGHILLVRFRTSKR
jgi:hypothetical protein